MGRRKGRDPLKCLVCCHKDRKAIENAVLAGETLRNISKQFGPSAPTLCRHKAHIAQSLALASEHRGLVLGESLLQKLDRMELDFARLSRRAELLGELPSAIVALREVRETLKVIHEMQQSVRSAEGNSINVRIIHVGRGSAGESEVNFPSSVPKLGTELSEPIEVSPTTKRTRKSPERSPPRTGYNSFADPEDLV